MSITAELFWSNLNRWQKYHGFTRSELERQINYRIGGLKILENKGSIPHPRVIDKLVNAFEIEHIEMLTSWTDEEWEKVIGGE